MKTHLLIPAICAFAMGATFFTQPLHAEDAAKAPPEDEAIDETQQFIFYSVLEGLYEDGVSNEDVAQILMLREGEPYFHFIYACPICTATIWALEAYQARPKQLYSLKRRSSTFGPGLSAELHAQLFDNNSDVRLTAINTMVNGWMERRMAAMKLSKREREALTEQLEKKRKEGMDFLESYRKLEHGKKFGVAQAAPAYVDRKECAVCNAAVGKPMKLPE